MAGAERLCHIFEWGREVKKVGNHWSSGTAQLRTLEAGRVQLVT